MSSYQMNQIRKAYMEFIQRWYWNFLLTLTFRSTISLEKGDINFRILLNRVSEIYKIKAAALIQFAQIIRGNILGNSHIHSLIIVDQAFRRNLGLIDYKNFFSDYLSKHWNGKYCFRVLDESGIPTVARYLCKEKNLSLSFPDNSAIEYFRPNLLKRLGSLQGSLISFPLGKNITKQISPDLDGSAHT